MGFVSLLVDVFETSDGPHELFRSVKLEDDRTLFALVLLVDYWTTSREANRFAIRANSYLLLAGLSVYI
jgi:hypothetical protein